MTNGTTMELVLVDLSSIAYPIWHTSQSDPDANKTSQLAVARVRTLAGGHPHAAVCCDVGASFRRDVSATYKANRPEHDASLQHQIALVREQLEADGFPVWGVKGFEADDLIATAVRRALESPERSVLVVSADKDLLQLIGDRVRVMNAGSGVICDAEYVKAKFGVRPDQVRDFLTLVGDTSDNVKGAKNIGPKTAADLLTRFETIEGIYEALAKTPTAFKPATATSLKEFQSSVDLTRQLITLRTDVELPFEEIAGARVPKVAESFASFVAEEDDDEEPAATPGPVAVADPPSKAITVREPGDIVLPAPAEWERGLDPRSMKDARILALDLYNSRMFSAYGTPQGVLSTIMVGRELGLPAMASLRQIHNIEGRHALAASLMVALILKSGFAEYFRPVDISETSATYETLRRGPGNKPFTLTHTIQMAVTAQLVKPNSNWEKVPTDMLVARCQSRLARLIYPDVIGSLYTPDELSELRQAVA